MRWSKVAWHAGPSTTHAEVTREDTGEIYAAVSLAQWERLVALAAACAPCSPPCDSVACRLARLVGELEEQRSDVDA